MEIDIMKLKDREIKALLFDMDGTMFDTENLSVIAWQEVSKSLGFEVDPGFIVSCMGLTSKLIKEKYIKEYGDIVPYEVFRERELKFMRDWTDKNGVPIKAGLVETLDFARKNGLKRGVATSSMKQRAMYSIEKSGLLPYFDVIITGDMCEKSKPEPDIYLLAADRIGVDIKECAVFEDSHNGIISASRSGAYAILIPDVVPVDDEMKAAADMTLGRLDDIIPYLGEQPDAN